ncbi:MAG: XRE family transcriptional regulator [Bacillota bacterium]|nr:XRE family transcriptional regulator [Bacillota bacterium]
MDYLSHNIAINLKRIRKAKGMSLDVVAEQTGVSKSMLATIEKGDANPSIGVLGKIMSGLRIDLQDLTDAPPKDTYMVDIQQLEPTKDVPGQYKVWTCFPIEDNRCTEIYRIDIEPGGVYESGSHGERTKEYISMLEGRLEIEIEGKVYVVENEQFFRFESDRRHVYRNCTNSKIRFISFFVEY